VKKGVPVRLEVGMKECQQNTVFVGRRDKEYKERFSQDRNEFIASITQQLDEIQTTLLTRARQFQEKNTIEINSKEDFYEYFTKGTGGFALAHWNGSADIEAKIKQDLNVTIRCIPVHNEASVPGTCIFSGETSRQRVIFAKAY
jgi:prolyl-tRNA synthetase